jgi:hypothetical protein
VGSDVPAVKGGKGDRVVVVVVVVVVEEEREDADPPSNVL